ncbi:leucine-rich repeats and immunoglobulin-like domains protein 3 isoform X2 [Artemia franciscana]|uniref:leucine-rich repeats and immunoglobulin-like domains protein 3 isoform X2 n=1 Tax=Artemia franciscana TaxID=6661 RepID=UPI0032D9B4C9
MNKFGMMVIFLLFGLATAEELCPDICSCFGGLVDCSKKGLSDVPDDLPSWTEFLELQGNKITDLPPKVFSRLLGLRYLKLHQNRLTDIPVFGTPSKISLINLGNNEIQFLRENQFMGLKQLKQLDLSGNKLKSFQPGLFPEGVKLELLNLNNNRISSLDKTCLNNLTNLYDLRLNRNRLQSLPKELFKKQANLKVLDLNRNSLKEIDGLLFDGLAGLTTLRLRKNEINTLSDGAFWGLGSLTQLQLDGNNISSIRKGWLYGLTTLEKLSLSYNRISSMEKDAWQSCHQLAELDLTNNELTRIERGNLAHLSRLESLHLNGNKINFIREGAFANLGALKILELGRNQISWIIEDTNSIFFGLNYLTKLGLADNQIKSIARRAFAGLDSLQVLDLSANPITTLEDNPFAEIRGLSEIHVNTSSLLCDCQLRWLTEWLRVIDFGSEMIMKCAHPETLQGLPLAAVPLQSLVCDDYPKPLVTEEPKGQIALRGGNFTLRCTAESTAAGIISFQWKKDDVVLTLSEISSLSEGSVIDETLNSKISDDEKKTVTTSELVFSNVTDSDGGRYQCIASNSFGTTYSSKAKILVHVFPSFTKVPTDARIKVGGTARLECDADGYPSPEISWFKDGGSDFPAARERRMHVMPEDDVYFITGITPSDIGVYTCMAKNPAGSVTANASLTVLETPDFVRPMEPSKEVMAGSTAVLECMASGSPKPRLVWTKDGGPLPVTERHFFTADNQLLIIVHVKESDTGRYECEMSNVLGKSQGATLLAVKPAPLTFGLSVQDGATIAAIIVIVVVLAIVLTSVVWVYCIYRSKKQISLPEEMLPPGSEAPVPDFTMLYPEMDVNYSNPSPYLHPQYSNSDHSDSESLRDSGTGDSARDEVTGTRDEIHLDHESASLLRGSSLQSLHPTNSELSCDTRNSSYSSKLSVRPRHVRTLSTFQPVAPPRPPQFMTKVNEEVINLRTNPLSQLPDEGEEVVAIC